MTTTFAAVLVRVLVAALVTVTPVAPSNVAVAVLVMVATPPVELSPPVDPALIVVKPSPRTEKRTGAAPSASVTPYVCI